MIRATLVDPVYEMWSYRSLSSSVVSATPPVTTDTISGAKYCGMISARTSATAAETSEGLRTTVFPAASMEIMGRMESATG